MKSILVAGVVCYVVYSLGKELVSAGEKIQSAEQKISDLRDQLAEALRRSAPAA